ncbi:MULTISPECIES: ferredoxin family protein [Sporomusa]|uniref:indolepyruvate ferredoxin oxidoreductase subunit alpha n=1 Tax=Sporomusa TaxID=2375 RepID=UPI0016669157|nr:ferredoxin family protein [Sporomusa sp. GT1]
MKVVIDAQKCVNKRFARVKCTDCRDSCPAKCINETLEIGNHCTNCGLCLAVCPAEAIGGVSYSVEAVQQLFTSQEPIRLICQRCQPDSLWPCLGFLDPTLLLALVFSAEDGRREVAIYQEECRQCCDEIAEHLVRTVAEANRLMGSGTPRIVNAKQKFDGLAPKAVSRREFFAKLWESSVSTIRDIAFATAEEMRPIPRRDLFSKSGIAQLHQSELYNQTTFKKLAVGKKCNTCGLCAKVCSAGAIATASKEGIFKIRHNPARCKNCGVCAVLCPQGAISLLPASLLAETIVGLFNMPVCQDCGRKYQPVGNAGVCSDCMQKSRIFSS